MVIVPLPKPPELEKLLGSLLTRPVKVVKLDPGQAMSGAVVNALFATGEPVLQVLVRTDLTLAASLAAALSVVPFPVVREAVRAGQMDESLQDNFSEVMNVLSRFISGSGRAFRLGSITCPPKPLEPGLAEAVKASDELREFTVDVPGYAAGRLDFVTL
jgi:hypothetical protein